MLIDCIPKCRRDFAALLGPPVTGLPWVAPDIPWPNPPLLPKRKTPPILHKDAKALAFPRQPVQQGRQGANTSNCSAQQSSQKASEEDATWYMNI